MLEPAKVIHNRPLPIDINYVFHVNCKLGDAELPKFKKCVVHDFHTAALLRSNRHLIISTK